MSVIEKIGDAYSEFRHFYYCRLSMREIFKFLVWKSLFLIFYSARNTLFLLSRLFIVLFPLSLVYFMGQGGYPDWYPFSRALNLGVTSDFYMLVFWIAIFYFFVVSVSQFFLSIFRSLVEKMRPKKFILIGGIKPF